MSVIIPARNEAANLPALLDSLRAQRPPPAEVIVVDDHSGDGTAQTARTYGATVLKAAELPPNWNGKPWACWQGAQHAQGEILVFLDADVRLESGGLGKLIDTWMERGGLLSVQPYHRMERAYEQLAAFFNVVAMAGLGVFGLGAERRDPIGAFGPCNVCGREDYLAVGGHSAAASAVVESLPLGKAFLAAGRPVRCMGGRGAVAFRMYPGGWPDLVEGFGKGFALGAHALPGVWLMLVVGWLCAGFEPLRHLLQSALTGNVTGLFAATLAYLLFAGQLLWMLVRIGNFRPTTALVYPVPLIFFLGVFLKSLLGTFLLRRVTWKGRVIGTS
ncbi:glycosyltransferase family 2 protein [Methylomagnum sp.]